jgi:glycosyltransferase involved in cell wall biosynthesis
MRVLHLPLNVASQITDTVRALCDIGVEARGLAFPGLITSNEAIEIIPDVNKKSLGGFLRSTRERQRIVFEAIAWADIVHWYCRRGLPYALDLRHAQRLGKKMVVEYGGADIRIPEIEMADNPYYAEVWKAKLYEYKYESLHASRRHQQIFARYGAKVIIPYDALLPYVQPDLFPEVTRIKHRIYLADYIPHYVDPQQRRPLVIHSPSRVHAKGTPAVLAAVEQLRTQHDFEFTLVQHMPYLEARRLMESCDIYLDQFVLGAHGVAALEAMALGKPVVCYIKPALQQQYPPDLPIVNATKDTLTEVLASVLTDGQRRRLLGEQGRAYVERYHDAHRLARELAAFYQTL